MATLAELQQLHHDLDAALKQDQYHRLLEFDTRIRGVIESLMEQVKQQPRYAPVLYSALQKLLATYQQVVARCSEVSSQLQQELQARQTQGRQTLAYLNVAGQSR